MWPSADDENARDLLGILATSELLEPYVVTPALNYDRVPGIEQGRVYHLQPAWPPAIVLDAYNPYRKVMYERVFDEIDPDITLVFGQSHLRFITATIDVTPTVFLPQGFETDQAVGSLGFGVSNVVDDPAAGALERFVLRPLYRRRFRAFLDHVTEVWTQEHAREAYTSLGLRSDAFVGFDWGPVDTDRFTPDVDPVDYVDDPEATVIGTFRRFREIDLLGPSYDTFLDAFGRVADRQSDVYLVIGGYGFCETDLREYIDTRIRRYGIEDRVIRLDVLPKEDMPAHYAGFDVYVNPTFKGSSVGGIGTSSKEAMACGCAFVTFNDPPMDYVIEDGRNGYIVEHGRAAELANALERLHDSPDHLDRLERAARETVTENFAHDVVRRRFERRCADIVGHDVDPYDVRERLPEGAQGTEP